MKRVDTQTLTTFVALCNNKSFSRTAEALFVTQSTVTKRIAQLEDELSQKLFVRDKRSVRLTEEGSVFLAYAERIIELVQASVNEMNVRGQINVFLRIGATNSIYECHLLPLIAEFMQPPKNNMAKIMIGHSADLLPMLYDGALDTVFSYTPFRKAGYECTDFMSDELVLSTDYKNDLYREGIALDELVKINYLMCNFALKEVGQYIRELFPRNHRFSLEIDNSTKLIPFLLGGTGYSFLPKKMVEKQLAEKELRIIPLTDFKAPVIKSYCVYRCSKKPLIQELLASSK